MGEDSESTLGLNLWTWLASGYSVRDAGKAWLASHVCSLERRSGEPGNSGRFLLTVRALAVADPDWLREVWLHYGKRMTFEMIRTDWPVEYFDLLQKMDARLIEVWPNRDLDDGSGQPATLTVRIKPAGLELLRRSREVHRQVTINGNRIDLRNERAHAILTPPIENLITMIPIWIQRLKIERDPRPWRAIRLQLERLLNYRAHELPPTLKAHLLSVLGECTSPNNGDPPTNAESGS